MSDANKPVNEQQPKRGRGRPRIHESDAARVAAWRESHGVEQLNVQLPADLMVELRAYHARQLADGAGLSMSQVIAKLIRSQLLRKR